MASQGSWGDWQVRQIAENMAEKRPKREWFEKVVINQVRNTQRND